uniref:Uncharacterized protein n=1 Tax=Myotis myotis TaxID=51298 RepID=A0A7J7Z4E4_MYOMY|nr:hypothetical protein mMyoMyo1_010398 [Myotis myotis]
MAKWVRRHPVHEWQVSSVWSPGGHGQWSPLGSSGKPGAVTHRRRVICWRPRFSHRPYNPSLLMLPSSFFRLQTAPGRARSSQHLSHELLATALTAPDPGQQESFSWLQISLKAATIHLTR